MNKTHNNKKAFKRLLTNLPDSLDLGFTAISTTTTQIFYLDNPNDVSV